MPRARSDPNMLLSPNADAECRAIQYNSEMKPEPDQAAIAGAIFLPLTLFHSSATAPNIDTTDVATAT